MGWTIGIILSASVLLASILIAILLGVGKYRPGRISTPFNVFFGGVFISVFICLLPIYHNMLLESAYNTLKTVMFSLHNTFQIFTIDADRSVILENITCPDEWVSAVYSAYLSVAFVLAPILTFGFLMTFFKNLSAYIKYILRFFDDVYIFSELNDKSLALAADIKCNHRHSAIVFTDVFENNDEVSYELIERARELKAICFKKDVLAVNFKLHSSGSRILFFTIGEDETENIKQSLKIIDGFKHRSNTELYVFSTGIESDLLLARADKGGVKVRRVNEVRSLINRLLYDDGQKIFERAVPISEDTKQISAVLIGMGQHGTEMLKALTWFCQMDGYKVQIDAFDLDKLAGERFEALAPELMSDEYNGVSIPGEAEYTIRIHSGYDVSAKSFADEIMKLKNTTYVLVSLGTDEMNIRTAVNLRILFERIGIKPVIQTIVYNTDEKEALTGIANYKNRPYDIDFIGDIKSSYSTAVIMNSELEKDALQRHLKWGEEDTFWQYEYNYSSSVASAIHMKARIGCGIPGATKSEDELTSEERDIIEVLEHRRWNAYMRSEGYVYGESTDKDKNTLRKMHHDLVKFSLLTEEEKRKDSRVGTK
ncbi:MAG: hypothetical protein J1F23_05145 [Oscillospiraceae bacterium]|nr:hypothetical protein [Oscillospiraceae bacterium]